MKYYLRRHAIGPQVIVEIDQTRYERLVASRNTLVDALSFEQRYELLLGNFTAFEMFCAELSMRSNFEFDFRYEKWAIVLADANRHALNFLATARQYADQLVRDFEHLKLSEPFSETAKGLLSRAYDDALEYQFVCELRNYLQHRSSAIHGMKGRGKDAPWAEGTMLYCQKKLILEDRGKFKMRILERLDDEIDMLAMFRGYMAQVSRVQFELRKKIKGHCEVARSSIQEAMSEFANAQGVEDDDSLENRAIGLTVVMRDGGSFISPVQLLLKWDDARIILGDKNCKKMPLLNKVS